MAKVEQGAALIAIEAEDRTNAAFLSVRENFQNFNQQIGNFEKNFRPIQELMEGGLAVSGSMAGLGALLQHSNSLGAALQDLQGRFFGVSSAAGEAGDALSAGWLSEVGEKVADAGEKVTKLFAGLTAGVAVISQVSKAWHAWQAIQAEVANLSKTTTAVETLDTAVKTANTVATHANTAAQGANAATTATGAAAKLKDTAAQNANTVAKAANAATTGACAIATTAAGASAGIFATITGVATFAVNALTISLGLNPITAWAVAITAAVAAIATLIAVIVPLVGSLVGANTEAERNVAKMRSIREAHEKAREECEFYTQRLEQLNQKEKLSAAEKEESARIVEKLNGQYDGLNLKLDETTGKVVGADGAFVDLKKAMADAAETDLNNELDALGGRLDELNGKLKNGEVGWGRWIGTWVSFGYVDNADEIKAKIAETEKEIEEARKKKTQNAMDRDAPGIEAEKKRTEEREKLLEEEGAFRKDLEKEIAQENQTAHEKELAAFDEKIQKRRELLQMAAQEGRISDEQAQRETVQLDQLAAKRRQQILQRHRLEREKEEQRKREEAQKKEKEGQQLLEDFETSVQQRKQKKEEEKEDAQTAKSIRTDPLAALERIQKRMAKETAQAQTLEESVRQAILQANGDGEITDAENAEIQNLTKKYQEALRQQERWEKQAEKAEAELGKKADAISKQAGTETKPIETLMAGSVEAYKKEIELSNPNQKSQEAGAIEKMEATLLKQAEKERKIQEETRDYTRKMTENMGAV
ncbi:MAG: hypothetical protein Q4D38_12215 [Planctomycetia bacterium]|nr:hypothetical protein [Planctomycetia bacterium]